MKKIIALLLAGTLIFAFTACEKKTVKQTDENKSENVLKNENKDDEQIEQVQAKQDQTTEDTESTAEENKTTNSSNSTQSNSSSSQTNAAKPNTNTTNPSTNTAKPNTNTPSVSTPAPQVNKTSADLIKSIDSIINGATDGHFKMVDNIALDSSNFKYYAFTDYVDGAVAVANESVVGSQAHSIVLVWVPNGTDVSSVAANMKKNMNPRKWVCVEAEKSFVKTKGNYILLVMTDTAVADKVEANFSNFAG